MDKKKISLVILLCIFIAIPLVIFLLSNRNVKTPTKNVVPAPTQLIGLCKQFEKVSYPLSCEKAVERALADTKGNIENITIGPLELNPSLKKIQDNLKFKNEMWRIDIKLAKPFTARNGNEVKSLRIQIPTDGANAIFRIPIKP